MSDRVVFVVAISVSASLLREVAIETNDDIRDVTADITTSFFAWCGVARAPHLDCVRVENIAPKHAGQRRRRYDEHLVLGVTGSGTCEAGVVAVAFASLLLCESEHIIYDGGEVEPLTCTWFFHGGVVLTSAWIGIADIRVALGALTHIDIFARGPTWCVCCATRTAVILRIPISLLVGGRVFNHCIVSRLCVGQI